jgi:hypothetical protein
MSFLNKFKYHYHLKHIDNLFEEKNYKGIFDYLYNIRSEEKLFYELSLKYISNSINSFNQDVLNKKIVWINTFFDNDSEYLRVFIQHYIQNFKNLKQDIKSYKYEIDQIISSEEDINFNTLVNQSYFFQWMILNRHNVNFKFLHNEIPFFSSENNYNFTRQSLTQAYILILNNPYEVYSKIKKLVNQDQEIARNIFLNLDQKAQEDSYSNVNFKFPSKGWHIHTDSWSDQNVLTSLRGKIISKKEINNNTFETLSSVILHLIQSGVEMELNYDLIELFINNNPIKNSYEGIELSNREKKFLSSFVDSAFDTYDI